jgi:hypothetical protein
MFQKLVDRIVLGTVAFFFGIAVTVLRRFKRP